MNIISLAAVRGENTSASYVFVFVGVLSSLPPAPHTEAAFLLSGQHSYVVGLRRTCVATKIAFVRLIVGRNSILNFPAKI